MCGRIGVVPAGEVPVVAGDDGVLLALLDVLPVPLPDAGAAGVGKDDPAKLAHGLGKSVTFDCGSKSKNGEMTSYRGKKKGNRTVNAIASNIQHVLFLEKVAEITNDNQSL